VRADAARADRNRAIQLAAEDWRRAGILDDARLAGVRAAYPDDRSRLGPVFRVLVFLFTALALAAAYGTVVAAGLRGDAAGFLALVYGALLGAATEYQIGALRRSEGGTETATSAVALGFLLGGAGWIFASVLHLRAPALISLLLAVCAALFTEAARRWGYPLYAAIAAGSAFGLLARLPGGRWIWIAASLAAIVPLLRASDSPRLPPSHRSSALAAALVSVGALYVALHLVSFDQGLIESFAHVPETSGPPNTALRPLCIAGTALVPIGVLVAGIRSRRRLLLDAGIVLSVASLVTLRFYVHVAPLWLILLVSGAAAIGVALALRRWLDDARRKERHGFTAEPLFEQQERQRALEIAAAAISLGPESRELPREKPAGFEGGGGRSGGAGATGSWE
jgi:hypothetical protein